MYCSRCGKKVLDSMLYCPFCGAEIIIPEQEPYDGGAEPERMVRGEIPENLKDAVEPGMEVRLGAEKGAVSYVYKEENTMMFIVTMENADLDLPDGEYDAELVLEKAAPISFLWN